MVKVVQPATAAEVAEVLRDASAAGHTVVPRGGGTKLDWGSNPSTVDIMLDLGLLDGVDFHAPADLVATVRAGTPLADLQAALAPAGQRLSLDSPSSGATIGGVLATGEGGPLRQRYGTGRDLLIGVEFVRADGVIARSGGRVVKNVAGYDVGKLLCGSYGTLAVITSATFRLHPTPAARAWICRPVETPMDVHDLIGAIVMSTVDPSAVEVDLPALGSGMLAVLVEGTPGGVAKRAEATRRLLAGDEAGTSIVDTAPPWWNTYPFEPGDVALELIAPVDALHAGIYALHDAVGAAVPLRGSVGVGVVTAALPGELSAGQVTAIVDIVRDVLAARGGSCVVLTGPPSVRESVDLWGDVPGLELMRQVKARFDPGRTLSPGRFVGGI